jgi:hypothetical protein
MGYTPPARPGEADPMVGFSLFLALVGFVVYPVLFVLWVAQLIQYAR